MANDTFFLYTFLALSLCYIEKFAKALKINILKVV